MKFDLLRFMSLKSFIYSLTELLYFPGTKVKEIYQKCQIEKSSCYHVLTDTDSRCLQFLVISDTNSDFPEKKIGDVIFDCIVILSSTNVLILLTLSGITLMREKKRKAWSI